MKGVCKELQKTMEHPVKLSGKGKHDIRNENTSEITVKQNYEYDPNHRRKKHKF